MSNQDSETSTTVSDPVSGLPTVPWSRKRERQERAAKMRQKKRVVEQTDDSQPGPSYASTLGSSDQDLVAPLTPASVPRDRTAQIQIITPTASALPDPQSSPSPPGDTLPTVDDSAHVISSERPGSSTFSPQSLAWSRKRWSNEKAELMRASKLPLSVPPVSPDEPLSRDPDYPYRSEEEPDESSEEEFDSQEALDDWMITLRLEQRRMLAVTLMESFKTRQKMNVKDAAREAGSIVGFSDKTVRKYRNDFFANKGSLTPLKQGKYERHCVYHDEQLNHKAAEWVRAHAFVKGEPNMTAQSFCDWINSDLLVSSHLPPFFPREISLRTAIRWLHHLGFKPVSHKKGVYIDGHEREDVVRHRESLLKILEDLRSSHRPLPCCSDDPPRVRLEADEEKNELVLIFHDESIFNTNEGQTWMWGESERPAILPKTKGSGIMVSDFVEEHGGYLKLTPEELESAKEQYPSIDPNARRLLEYGAEKEGYWTSERFMEQIQNAADIADIKYRHSHTIVWLFDQSSCHRKFDELALQAGKILVKDGGRRRVRDTVWAGRPQSMVNADGSAKGLRTILLECGINTVRMKADDMRVVLSNHEDFATEDTIVEHYLKSRGHCAYFLPKFHCELNPIEHVWAQAKVYCRAYTNFTVTRLRQIIHPALDSVSVDLIRKFARKARDYEKAYREGNKAGKAVENAVKKYKSHRRVFIEEL